MGQLVLKTKRTLYQASNMLSGILLRFLNPFRKGDFIEINGQLGSVEHKGYKNTILKNVQGEEIQIANSTFYAHALHNLTTQNIVDVDCVVSVVISSNMMKVKQLISDFSIQYSASLNSPSVKIFVKKIKNNHIDLGVRVWCHIEKHLEVDSEFEELLKRHLSANGVELETEKTSELKRMTA